MILWLLASVLWADTAVQNYDRLCAGCHGAMAAGGRAPALGASMRRVHDIAGFESLVRAGIPGTEMPATPPNRLSDADLKALSQWVWSLRTGAAAAELAQIGRGRDLFRGKGNCMRCHSLGGEGVPYGPDLTYIGQRRSSIYLRNAIVEPQAEISDSFENYQWWVDIPDNFVQVRLVTTSGRRLTAARVNEDAFSIQVRDQQGKLHSFLKSELAELNKEWGKSPMPTYKGVLTELELTDLVVYLAAQRRSR